jgi:prevent-host-death family protein
MAMKSVKIAELKDRLSEHLRAVERGDEVIVTDRNRPIARIVPLDTVGARTALVPPQVPFATIRDRRWRAAGWSIRSDELLAEERAER